MLLKNINIADYLTKILTVNLEIQHSKECLTFLNRGECFIHNDKTCFESVESFISLYKLRLSIWEQNGYNESKQWNDLFEKLETTRELKFCAMHFYSGKLLFQIYFNLKTEFVIAILRLEQKKELNREEFIGKANFVHKLPEELK